MIKDTHDLRFNTYLGWIEYDSGAEIWLPAAPPAPLPGSTTVQNAVAADFGPELLYTVPSDGMYTISYYIVNTTSGTGGDAVGQLVFNYTDASGGNALYASMPSGTNATLLGNGSAPVYLIAGSTVTSTLGSAVFAGGYRAQIVSSVSRM